MSNYPITTEHVVATIRRMAIENGISEEDIQEYLDKYALQYGNYVLLRSLARANYNLNLNIRNIEYAISRGLALEMLADILESGEKILSVGCNVGLLESNLARIGFRVWGLDINEEMIEVSKRLAKDMKLSKNCRFIRIEGNKYPFPDESFDSVLFSHSLHEIDDKNAALGESYRILKPGGRTIILEDEVTEKDVMKPINDSQFAERKGKVVSGEKICNHDQITPLIMIILVKKQS